MGAIWRMAIATQKSMMSCLILESTMNFEKGKKMCWRFLTCSSSHKMNLLIKHGFDHMQGHISWKIQITNHDLYAHADQYLRCRY